MKARIAALKTEGEALPTGATKRSGYAFGGRFEKANHKNHWILWYMFWIIVWAVCNKLDYFLTCIYPNMYENTSTCRISDISTSARIISQIKWMISKSNSYPFHGRCKVDSRVDTTVTGKNYVVLKYTDLSFDVAPFSDKYTPMKDVPIVSAATVYISANGKSYILVFN